MQELYHGFVSKISCKEIVQALLSPNGQYLLIVRKGYIDLNTVHMYSVNPTWDGSKVVECWNINLNNTTLIYREHVDEYTEKYPIKWFPDSVSFIYKNLRNEFVVVICSITQPCYNYVVNLDSAIYGLGEHYIYESLPYNPIIYRIARNEGSNPESFITLPEKLLKDSSVSMIQVVEPENKLLLLTHKIFSQTPTSEQKIIVTRLSDGIIMHTVQVNKVLTPTSLEQKLTSKYYISYIKESRSLVLQGYDKSRYLIDDIYGVNYAGTHGIIYRNGQMYSISLSNLIELQKTRVPETTTKNSFIQLSDDLSIAAEFPLPWIGYPVYVKWSAMKAVKNEYLYVEQAINYIQDIPPSNLQQIQHLISDSAESLKAIKKLNQKIISNVKKISNKLMFCSNIAKEKVQFANSAIMNATAFSDLTETDLIELSNSVAESKNTFEYTPLPLFVLENFVLEDARVQIMRLAHHRA